MEDEARGSSTRVVDEGSTATASRSGSRRSPTSPTPCAALGDEAAAELLYPELEPFAGTNVMIGHLVACYGVADRYLGMLASTLGDARARASALRARARAQPPHGQRRRGSPTPRTSTRGLLARLGDATRRRCSSRRSALAEPDRHAARCRARSAARARAARGRPARTASRPREANPASSSRGGSNRQIGAALVISEHTAANHVRSILRKTGCANRTEAASYAHRRGLGG